MTLATANESGIFKITWNFSLLAGIPMAEHDHRHNHRDMSNMQGTFRGATPKRPAVPFENSPAVSSNIPRPKLETTNSEMSGHSTISASRQKQSRRDEVSPSVRNRARRKNLPFWCGVHKSEQL